MICHSTNCATTKHFLTTSRSVSLPLVKLQVTQLTTEMEDSQLLFSYVFSSSSDRERLEALYPDVFTFDIIEALQEASSLLSDTAVAVDDANRVFDSVMDQLDLPVARQVLLSNSAPSAAEKIREQFQTVLRSVVAAQLSTAQELQQVPLHDVGCCKGAWWLDRTLVYCVLSFLPCEFVLTSCEDLCRPWRVFLCDGSPESQAHWLGHVQQEFPDELACWLQAAASGVSTDLLATDWRTVAMTIVCDIDDEEDEEGIHAEG